VGTSEACHLAISRGWPARENLQSFSALWRFEQGQAAACVRAADLAPDLGFTRLRHHEASKTLEVAQELYDGQGKKIR
jgi:hypothetical protein